MNKIEVFFITLAVSSHLSAFDSKTLDETDDLVLDLTNKLFSLLGNNLTRSKYNNSLQQQREVKIKTESYCKLYKDIANAIKVEGNKTGNDMFNLTDTLGVVFQEMAVIDGDLIEKYLEQLEGEVNLNVSLNYPSKTLNKYRNGHIDNMTIHEGVLTSLPQSVDRNKTQQNHRNGSEELKTWRGHKGTVTRRVYEGQRIRIEEVSFVASLLVNGQFVCAGAIIADRLLLSAASCLLALHEQRGDENKITVRVGSGYTYQFGTEMTVDLVKLHPGFDSTYFINNLAIVRVTESFRKLENLSKIEYQGNGDLREFVTMFGWGDKDNNVAGYFGPLLYTKLKHYDTERCKIVYSRFFVDDKNFCAGFEEKGGGACKRDVGGPAVAGDRLVGVVSFGPPVCGTPDFPTVFTDLTFYKEWIDSVVQKMQLLPGRRKFYDYFHSPLDTMEEWEPGDERLMYSDIGSHQEPTTNPRHHYNNSRCTTYPTITSSNQTTIPTTHVTPYFQRLLWKAQMGKLRNKLGELITEEDILSLKNKAYIFGDDGDVFKTQELLDSKTETLPVVTTIKSRISLPPGALFPPGMTIPPGGIDLPPGMTIPPLFRPLLKYLPRNHIRTYPATKTTKSPTTKRAMKTYPRQPWTQRFEPDRRRRDPVLRRGQTLALEVISKSSTNRQSYQYVSEEGIGEEIPTSKKTLALPSKSSVDSKSVKPFTDGVDEFVLYLLGGTDVPFSKVRLGGAKNDSGR